MATFITIPAGQFPFSFLGTMTMSLADQPWYTAANVNKIFAVNSTRKGYVSGVPGNGFGTTQLIAAVPGQALSGYVLDLKAAIQVDISLFGALPAGQNIAAPVLGLADSSTGNLRLAVPAGTTIDEVKLIITP